MSEAVRCRDALEASIRARLGACAHDELRVVDAILLRLELGRDQYGPLDLNKPRDWAREEAEEHIDAVVYRACALISRQDAHRRELRGAAGREMVEAGLSELRESEMLPRPLGSAHAPATSDSDEGAR